MQNNHAGVSWSARLLPPTPVRMLIASILTFLCLFSLGRLLFLLTFLDRVEGIDPGTIFTSLAIGIRFDLVVTLIALLPVLLAVSLLEISKKGVRVSINLYQSAIFSLYTLGILSDIRYYVNLENHLDFRVFEYFNQGNTFWHLVVKQPNLYLMIAGWVIVSALFYLGFSRLWSQNNYTAQPGWIKRISYLVIFLALFTLGIRGRVSTSPIDWSVSYISQNHLVNQLGLNGVYTLCRAWLEEGHEPRLGYLQESERFAFLPLADAVDSLRSMLGSENDVWSDNDSSLSRITRQPPSDIGFQPNVVIVLMESWSGRNTGALGSAEGLTPVFDSLSEDGILFTDFYTSGTRTNYGIAATLCSFPSVPGRSILRRYYARHEYNSVAEILGRRGYHSSFVYGGDKVFDNMEGFLRTTGFDLILGEVDFPNSESFTTWGIPDHKLFLEAASLTGSLPRPFLSVILTLSNHEPFDLPDSSVWKYPDDDDLSREYNAQLYADKSLGLLMESMKQLPVHDSTIYMFISDHCKWNNARFYPSPINFRIPFLIYSPALLGDSAIRIDRIGGQTDVIPTLMGILGGDYEHASFGRNLLHLSDSDSGFAFSNVINWCVGIDNQGYMYEHVGRESHYLIREEMKDSIIYREDREKKRFETLRRRTRIVMQVGDQLSTPTVP